MKYVILFTIWVKMKYVILFVICVFGFIFFNKIERSQETKECSYVLTSQDGEVAFWKCNGRIVKVPQNRP